ncbi:MAG: DUF1292 domain-containing protein [Clostridia bacterium]|nr:DUF1292 domain-containing protein [Clostridia bacterium]
MANELDNVKKNLEELGEDYVDPISAILDPDNEDNIILFDENNNETEFSQVAVIPLNEKIYVILKPETEIEGVGEDEALVFIIEEIEDEDTLVLCCDEDAIDKVFEEYYKLLREAGVDTGDGEED